jgi:hypothetical protein
MLYIVAVEIRENYPDVDNLPSLLFSISISVRRGRAKQFILTVPDSKVFLLFNICST